jgi:hypothetical protein
VATFQKLLFKNREASRTDGTVRLRTPHFARFLTAHYTGYLWESTRKA